MIHYALRCDHAHEFDGWFAGSAAFDAQVDQGLVACPRCGSSRVERALMAPSVARNAVMAPPPESRKPGLPPEMLAVLQRLRAAVERHCDYVGPAFADQALRMHRGELDARAIYGETSEEDAELLADEGVEVGRIPWVPRADS